MKHPNKKACEMSTEELASYIDYSVLKPEFTEEEIIDLTKDGVKLGCATICINPAYMELLEPYVKGSKTMLCPVTDFPFGASSTKSRVEQIEEVAKYDTVKEVDIVANFGKIRSGLYDEVLADLKECAQAAHKYGREIKVIFETDALNEEQIRKMCLDREEYYLDLNRDKQTVAEQDAVIRELKTAVAQRDDTIRTLKATINVLQANINE